MESTSVRCYFSLSTNNLEQFEMQKQKFKLFNIPVNEYKFIKTKKDFGIELFDTGKVLSLFVEEVINGLINKILYYLPDFNFSSNNLDFSTARIEVVIHIYNNEIPSIYLNRKILRCLNKLDIEIEFDMYHFDTN